MGATEGDIASVISCDSLDPSAALVNDGDGSAVSIGGEYNVGNDDNDYNDCKSDNDTDENHDGMGSYGQKADLHDSASSLDQQGLAAVDHTGH